MFGRDPRVFAYEPLDGYTGARDAVPLPCNELERGGPGTGRRAGDLIARRPGERGPG